MATQLWFVGSSTVDTHRGTNSARRDGTPVPWIVLGFSVVRSGIGSVSTTGDTVTGATVGVELGSTTTGYEWISLPVAADVTISGTITANLWGLESAMTANVALNVIVDIIRANSVGADGSNTIQNIVQSTNTVELGTGAAVSNFTTGMTSGAYTSQTLNRGDRLRVRVIGDDSAAATMAAANTFTFTYQGTLAAANGDSYITFTENITFEQGPNQIAQSISAGNGTIGGTSADQQVGHSFIVPTGMTTLNELRIQLRRSTTSVTDNLIVELRTDASGSPSTTVVSTIATIAGTSLTTSLTEQTFPLAIAVTAGSTYWIVYRRSGATDITHNYLYGVTGVAPGSPWVPDKIYNGTSWSAGSFYAYARYSFDTTKIYLTNTSPAISGSAPTLLSDFTGADENPLSESGAWANLNSSGNPCKRISNAVTGTVGGANNFSYKTTTNYGPDLEMYFTATTMSAGMGVVFRVQQEGGANTWDGYRLSVGATLASLNRYLNGASAAVLLTASVAASDGDKFGVKAIGDCLQIWWQPAGGVWTLIGTAVDSTITAAGKVGIYMGGTADRMDDLYIGTDTALFTQEAWTTRGSGVINYTSDTVTGWTNPLLTQEWYTKPLAAFTLKGMALANIPALESSAAANVSLRCEIARVAADGTSPTLWSTGCIAPITSDSGELSTLEVARTAYLAGDDLAISDGQRLRFRIYSDNYSLNPMVDGFLSQIAYNGATAGGSGDAYVIFPAVLTPSSTSVDYLDSATAYVDLQVSDVQVADLLDSSTIPMVLGVSAVETKEISDSATVLVDLQSSGTEFVAHETTDAATALVDLQSSGTEFLARDLLDSATATVVLTVTATESAQFIDAATPYVDLQTSATEAADFTDSNTVLVDLQSSGTELREVTDAATPYVDISVSATELREVTDTATVLVDLQASGVDVYVALQPVAAFYLKPIIVGSVPYQDRSRW